MDKAHGRVERRRRTSTTARNGLVGWPEVGQVFEGERVRVAGGTGRVAVVYGLTRLRRERADARGPLGRLPGPWGIANGWHGVRDVTRGGTAAGWGRERRRRCWRRSGPSWCTCGRG